MVHRDLKLDNVLISTSDPTIEFNIKVSVVTYSHIALRFVHTYMFTVNLMKYVLMKSLVICCE